MKAWFTKLRISAALDGGKPLSQSLERKIEDSAELQRFVDRTAKLRHSLKANAKQQPQASASLHGSIMSAVRAAERRPTVQPSAPWWRQVAAPACFALVLLAVGGYLSRSPQAPLASHYAQTLAPAATALEQSGELVNAIPSAAMKPLLEEAEHLNRDWDKTTEFLLASIP